LRQHVLQTCQGFRLQTTFHEALMKAADSDQTYLATLKALLKGNSKVDTNFSIKKDLLLYKNKVVHSKGRRSKANDHGGRT